MERPTALPAGLPPQYEKPPPLILPIPPLAIAPLAPQTESRKNPELTIFSFSQSLEE